MKGPKSGTPSKHSIAVAIDLLLAVMVLFLSLTGCEGGQTSSSQVPVAIQKDDVCAVCGMYIEASPGPRGEAYVEGYQTPLKFDSTRDFFAFVMQPENKTRLQHLFVQDSAQINWQHPSNEARTFVDARSAYYVAWQPLAGSMGPTFASFAKQKEAEAFVSTHGGEILRYADITLELTSRLSYGCPAKGSPEFALARSCVAAPHVAGPTSAPQG